MLQGGPHPLSCTLAGQYQLLRLHPKPPRRRRPSLQVLSSASCPVKGERKGRRETEGREGGEEEMKEEATDTINAFQL